MLNVRKNANFTWNKTPYAMAKKVAIKNLK